VQLAQNALDAALLKAPIDGTVAAVTAAVGQQVGTNGASSTTSSTATTATSGFITLMTLQDLTVTAQVNEADVGKVTIGDPVSFTTSAFPGKVFGGQVTQIQPTGTTTSNVVSFAVTSSIKPLEGVALYPGMTATVTITTDEHKDVLTVPNSALSFAQTAARSTTTTGATTAGAQTAAAARPTGAGGQGAGAASAAAAGQGTSRSVMLLQDGQATPTRVTTGMTDGTNTEVVSGLQESQPVIVSQSGGTTATTAATGTTAATRTGAPATNPLTGGGPGFVAKP
jgi:HlyD family secretion protein